MQASRKYFIFVVFETKKFRYEKLVERDICVSVKKIIERIYEQFFKEREKEKIADYFLLCEDESFSELSFIDFVRYNQKEFVLFKPTEKLRDLIEKKKTSDEAKAKELKNISQSKSNLSSLIAKATKAKVELKNRKPANNANNNNINNFGNENTIININSGINLNLNGLIELANNLSGYNRDANSNGHSYIMAPPQVFYYDGTTRSYINVPLQQNTQQVASQYRINNNIPVMSSGRNSNLNSAQNQLMQWNHFPRRSFRSRNRELEEDDLDDEEEDNIESEYESDEERESFEESLSTLMAMGFSFENSERALRQANNNLEWAIQLLVNMRPRANNP